MIPSLLAVSKMSQKKGGFRTFSNRDAMARMRSSGY